MTTMLTSLAHLVLWLLAAYVGVQIVREPEYDLTLLGVLLLTAVLLRAAAAIGQLAPTQRS